MGRCRDESVPIIHPPATASIRNQAETWDPMPLPHTRFVSCRIGTGTGQFDPPGMSMMCAQGLPGFMSHGEPVAGVVESPVVSAVAYGM